MTTYTHGTDHLGAYPLTARCGAIVTDDGPGACVGPTWTRARVLDPRLGMLPPCPVCFPEAAAKRAAAPDLRGLAEAATPGPWEFDSYSRVWIGDADSESLVEVAAVPVVAGDTATRQGSADAAYIAAANPQAVIGLLDTIDRLHDLVRHQRGPLHDEGLLTDEEYAALAADHGAVARLETIDGLRAEVDRLTARVAEMEAGNAAAAERAAIVAFLRDGIVQMAAEHYGHELQSRSLRTLAQFYSVAADAIERGAHHEVSK